MDHAASEVLGNLLLLALFVAILASLGAFLFAADLGPQEQVRADFEATIQGDDVHVRHMGGDPIPRQHLVFVVSVGGTEHRFAHGDEAGQVFVPDTDPFTIGDRWHTTDLNLPAEGSVEVDIVAGTTPHTIWGQTLRSV